MTVTYTAGGLPPVSQPHPSPHLSPFRPVLGIIFPMKRFLVFVTLLFLLAGCRPTVAVEEGTPLTATPQPDNALALAPTFSPYPSPAATPTPDLPLGWQAHAAAEQGLEIYVPPAWEVTSLDAYHLDLREVDGMGWLEIGVLDEASEAEWGLDYRPAMRADELMTVLLNALRQNGDFEEAYPLLTRTGRTAWISTGTYKVLNERLLIGTVGLWERAIIVIGHGSEGAAEADEEWERLSAIYEQIMWSITPQGEN